MNILFIVTELNSANGICTQSVMRELTLRGHNVCCLTNREKHNDLDDKIQYYYVKPRMVYRLLSDVNNKYSRMVGFCLNKIKLLLSYPTWPLISPLYTRRIYKKAKQICHKNSINVIVPIYTQIDALIAAHRIKKKNPNIKYIPYFLDSLSGGYGPKCFSQNWLIRRGMSWEEKLLPLADKIVMMEASRIHYEKYCSQKMYFNKILFLDLPLISQPTESISRKTNTENIELLYIGSIPQHIRNPEPFLKVFCKMKNPRYRLHIVGTSTCMDMLSDYAKKDSRIILEAPIAHPDAIKRVAKADVLVNFGNNNSTMTPSKIFEYMSYGKPIISTMPILDEPSTAYLSKYPISYLLKYNDINYDIEAQHMEEWINKIIGKSIEFKSIEAIFTKNTPKCFCDYVIQHIIME